MSAFHFDPHAARKYGVNVAIILEALKFWLRKNKANHQNLYDGRFWTYNSREAWADLFSFWSERQVRRYLEKARECGAIAVGNYNKSSYDRTLWYTIIDPEIYDSTGRNRPLHRPKSADVTADKGRPIPDNNTQLYKTQIKEKDLDQKTKKRPMPPKNDPSSQPKPDSTVVERTRFQDFWDQYGRKVGRAKAEAYWTRNKLDKMADTILENIGARKAAGMHADPQFVPHPIRYLRDKMWDDEVTKIKSNGTAKPSNPPERRLTEDESWERDIKDFLERPLNYIQEHSDCGKVENHELLWRFMRSSNYHSPKSVTKLNGKLFEKEQAKELANGLPG